MNKNNKSPILLLDEIVAHLDEKIKLHLLNELKALGNQIWMSGADINLFPKLIDPNICFPSLLPFKIFP